MIRRALPESSGVDDAVEQVRVELAAIWPGIDADLDAELVEAREIVERQCGQIEVLRRHSVIRKRHRWYFGPSQTDRHWPRLRAYLEHVKGWPSESVAGIHEASNEIVSLLENPHQHQFLCRGLVVGHVQSGKTANMTAVIAKALDAGYNTVIVLAGLTNKLRFQTQARLVEDLVQRNQLDWQVLTPSDVDGDFQVPPYGGLLSHTDKAQLAVVKKNVSPLERLRVAVKETPRIALRRLRILVIDDECDQASVNAARGELDMTAINHRIRGLLKLLPAVSYVGYTATPFANVLINPYRVEGQKLDDLYPRDFITALPSPNDYFGAERLFGHPPVDPENMQPDEEGLDMIRIVPESEERLLQPPTRDDREDFYPEMARSLETAILYFLACCSARRARGNSDNHMTMLIHTSPYVVMHKRVAKLITDWKNDNRDGLLQPESEISRRLERVWNEEQDRLPIDITDASPVGIDAIRGTLREVLDLLEVPIENGSSADRIDYSGTHRTYIVVGGSILARGLTLEGLMVSYFLRSSSQYDTLLQMGRWFGYRHGYEDLPRIWMTEEEMLRFRGLAAIEREIRDEIEQYRVLELTPMEIAVRIRVIPGMAITGARKMRAARRCAVSFWGTHKQTFRFERQNAPLLRENWDAASELVNRAEALGCRDGEWPAKLWRGVPKSSIRQFFGAYAAHTVHADLYAEVLISFLDGGDVRLDLWHLGIVEPESGNLSTRWLGEAGSVRLVTRARLSGTGDTADIKALMSKRDIRFDCPGEIDPTLSWEELKAARRSAVGDVPLLLLYAIDRSSPPRRGSRLRVSLEAVEDVLGYGVVFPGSLTEAGNHVSVQLDSPSADEVLAIEAEEEAQAEAAGVT